jgi:hypothetical protein
MPTYNGHRSWNAWNVSLWLNNDEGLYNTVNDVLASVNGNKTKAVNILSGMFHGQRTPDGAKYNKTCIREALRGWGE